MSADDGIYIAKFPDGYRVTYAQCIENIDYFPPGSKKRKKELKSYFGKSPVFPKRKDAWKYASKLYHQMAEEEEKYGMFGVFILEYGICYIGKYEAFV
jgi:hypothetical protein